jgi:hypothetical protein
LCAQSAATESISSKCGGKQVVRCVWFNLDRANNRLRARSGIWDGPTTSFVC